MLANIVCPIVDDNLVLPPMDSPDGICLHYTDETGKVTGGLQGTIGTVPLTATAIVQVDVSAAMLEWLGSSPDYIVLDTETEDAPE